MSKYYKSVNSILRVEGVCSEMVLLRLIEAHSLPILSYGIEVIHVIDATERRQLRVAYNFIFRRVFHYRKYDSVSEIQELLCRPTWEALVEKRQSSFLKSVMRSDDDVLRHLYVNQT
jgi:hypothetical protein